MKCHAGIVPVCKYLQGKVIPQGKFLTGGIVREFRTTEQIRCDSVTDSKVWMKEDDGIRYRMPGELFYKSPE